MSDLIEKAARELFRRDSFQLDHQWLFVRSRYIGDVQAVFRVFAEAVEKDAEKGD